MAPLRYYITVSTCYVLCADNQQSSSGHQYAWHTSATLQSADNWLPLYTSHKLLALHLPVTQYIQVPFVSLRVIVWQRRRPVIHSITALMNFHHVQLSSAIPSVTLDDFSTSFQRRRNRLATFLQQMQCASRHYR